MYRRSVEGNADDRYETSLTRLMFISYFHRSIPHYRNSIHSNRNPFKFKSITHRTHSVLYLRTNLLLLFDCESDREEQHFAVVHHKTLCNLSSSQWCSWPIRASTQKVLGWDILLAFTEGQRIDFKMTMYILWSRSRNYSIPLNDRLARNQGETFKDIKI